MGGGGLSPPFFLFASVLYISMQNDVYIHIYMYNIQHAASTTYSTRVFVVLDSGNAERLTGVVCLQRPETRPLYLQHTHSWLSHRSAHAQTHTPSLPPLNFTHSLPPPPLTTSHTPLHFTHTPSITCTISCIVHVCKCDLQVLLLV